VHLARTVEKAQIRRFQGSNTTLSLPSFLGWFLWFVFSPLTYTQSAMQRSHFSLRTLAFVAFACWSAEWSSWSLCVYAQANREQLGTQTTQQASAAQTTQQPTSRSVAQAINQSAIQPANCANLLRSYTFTVKKQTLSKGIEIAYVDEGGVSAGSGNNETLLFVHGLASYLPAFDKTIEGLRSEYRCVALDLPGYGRSGRAQTVGIRAYADVIAEFIDSLRLSAVTLVGHSLGGQIAIRAALRYPKKIKRLVLLAPAGIETFSQTHRDFINERYTAAYTRNKSEAIIKSDYERIFFTFPSGALFMIQDRLAIRTAADFEEYCSVQSQSVRASVNEPVFQELGLLKQPTLIVFGIEDNMIPSSLMHPEQTTEEIAKLAAARIKRSKLVLLPECGHFLQYEKPRETNAAIREFLGGK
jgi:pimeloyl-ACP methyl ester carboxylesterase